MGFKVGDKVKILNTEFGNKGKIGVIENISGTTMIYFVKLDGSCNSQWSDASDLELVIEEVKVVAKVGDKVQINELGLYFGSCGIVTDNQRVGRYSHKVIFEDSDWSVFTEKDLIVLSTEEEKLMKFKVGDKVKVKDSWFGHDGQVGVVFRTDNYEPYNYNIKFDTEGYNKRLDEQFMGDSLELAKQSFTKSDLKTGMGVVLRDGSKGHVLLGTEAGDVIRFINGGSNQWASVDEYDENMIDCDMSPMDIIEVYSSRFAYACLTDRVFNQDCVFKRQEPKPEPKPEPEPTKMTMKEINEHFGKPIEIIE